MESSVVLVFDLEYASSEIVKSSFPSIFNKLDP